MTTKNSKPKSRKVYEKLGPYTIMKKPFVNTDGSECYLDVTTEQGDNTQHECTKDLYREIINDKLFSNYRVTFYLHKNSKDIISNISTEHKRAYDTESYKVEFEKEMEVPNKEVYRDPVD